jgi:hypothetical protein
MEMMFELFCNLFCKQFVISVYHDMFICPDLRHNDNIR